MVETLTVKVKHGVLKGRKHTNYYSFQGIPYAKPPIGLLRFQAPQPPEPWDGILDATKEGPVAPQKNEISGEYIGEEDCLYLNVYTPHIPVDGNAPSKHAVMVWIHGGAYTHGSGNSDIFGPDFLLTQGVVVVSLNYRLGALGFLNLENASVPGNAGMKDQVLALKWVQENISVFGGDPGNVTIFGHSAGASSVHLHILSPLSKGLFHRAIAQSGVAVCNWATVSACRTRAFRLGKLLGCDTTNTKELLEFLQTVPAKQLTLILDEMPTEEERRRGSSICFAPSVERGNNGEEAFLSEEPLNIIRGGNFQKVPLMTGVTSREAIFLLRNIFQDPSSSPLMKIGDDFEQLIPTRFKLERGSDESLEAAQEIKRIYFKGKKLTMDTLSSWVDLTSDLVFNLPAVHAATLHSALSGQPVYFYHFGFDGLLGFYKRLKKLDRISGVCHSDDLGYLFKSIFAKRDLPPDAPELVVSDHVVKLWTNYAKTGNPTPTDDPILDVKWDPMTASDFNYLNIDLELSMKKNLHHERLQFWSNLRDRK